jgi:hypothetical protein
MRERFLTLPHLSAMPRILVMAMKRPGLVSPDSLLLKIKPEQNYRYNSRKCKRLDRKTFVMYSSFGYSFSHLVAISVISLLSSALSQRKSSLFEISLKAIKERSWTLPLSVIYGNLASSMTSLIVLSKRIL